MYSKELIRGTLKTLILKLLTDNNRMYGYEITQRVEEMTEGNIQLTFGALYPILHKLEQDGLLSIEVEVVDNRARKYYSLTPQGSQVALLKIEELEKFLETLKIFLHPQTKPGIA